MSIRKALGAVKDQATIGIARVSGAVKPDLDVAIVRATSHDDAPPDDRHAREVLRLAAGGSQRSCVASLARRLARTRDYVVAAKCLALLHRLAAEGDPHLRGELLRPALSGRRAGEPVLSLLLDFRDEAHAASWDHSAFVRAYALYLDERVRFLASLLPPPRAVRFADDYGSLGGGSAPPAPPPATASVGDMDPERLLVRARQLRQLLDLFLACRPAGAARDSRVVFATLYPLLKESFQLYEDLSTVLAVLLDRFFDMEYPECVKAFETYVSSAKQIDHLLSFYAWCDDVGAARSSDFPEVKRIDEKLLETLEQFLRERGQASRSSPPPRSPQSADQSAFREQDEPAEYVDMDSIKALPAPEGYSAQTTRSVPAKASAAVSATKTPQARHADLVDLREPAATADEQDNKLALALFSAPPATNGTDSSWVAFPSESDDAPVATSAWQTPAAEPGKADWELALVETASNLSQQTASLGGGMDPLLLGGMYDQGAVRQQVAAHATSGSASSVALPTHGRSAAAPVLMLPAPDGTVQTIGGDPFAASLAVPPPSYVQMAEMERKQQLLVQEQQMWAQYRQGGMQGQPVGFNGLAAGSVFVASNTAVAVPYGMPMAYNHVGGYY
ncbi:putative clathrin assembly protein [Dichanthelium oligosanthes]|uniref:Putative clathrin assembly protein n=1 Tax=Dichanthelium oligosanthes TaxID=888268 RepID=A0A1E5V014_9POAL|nr:putative clathrin assembly protein [Dichanthelium oligosanthes]